MQVDEQPLASSSSGLQFFLHPLVVINISDHYTRTRANLGSPPDALIRVVGCLLGTQSGRTIDVSNSFEVPTSSEDPKALDFAYLHKRLEQYKQTFQNIDLIGWYATGAALSDIDMEVHRQIMELNAAPAFLLLDPTPRKGQKELPVSLYESELHVVDGAPSFMFTSSTYTMATSAAERIAVDQVAKLAQTGTATAATQLSSHVGTIHSAAKALVERVATLRTLLLKMQSGELPFDPVTVQRIAAFASRLPAADALGGVPGDNSVEGCDALLSTLLAGMTKGAAQALALADKHNIAYQKSSSGAGGGGGGSRGEERMTKRLPKPSFAVAEREKAGGGSASGL